MRSKRSIHISGGYHAVMCQSSLWTGAPVSEGTSGAGGLLSCAGLETLLGRALYVDAALCHSQNPFIFFLIGCPQQPSS